MRVRSQYRQRQEEFFYDATIIVQTAVSRMLEVVANFKSCWCKPEMLARCRQPSLFIYKANTPFTRVVLISLGRQVDTSPLELRAVGRT